MKFNYKKILAVIIIILTAALLFCGCGKSDNENTISPRTGNPEAYSVRTDTQDEPGTTDRNIPAEAETLSPTALPHTKAYSDNSDQSDAASEKAENASDNNTYANNDSTAAAINTPAPTIYENERNTDENISYVTVSIDCSTILNNMDKLAKNKQALIPQNGIILPPTEVQINGGESAFDILKTVTSEHKIHMEFSTSGTYKTVYIEGIANLYEFDCGNLSGWTYRVNNEFFSHGVSAHEVHPGDIIEFVYTCDLGKDVGASGSWE